MAKSSNNAPRQETDMWVAHEQPERPLEYGAWLCCCQECAVALHGLAIHRPGANVVLKSGMDRQVLPAIDVALARVEGNFESLLLEPGDYLREVFIGSGEDFKIRKGSWPSLPSPSSWLPCEECASSEES